MKSGYFKKFLFLAQALLLVAVYSRAAMITVLNNADSGAGSLREAIADASSGDTINFDASLEGETITLTSGELVIDKSLAIEGPGPDLLTIDGNGVDRVLRYNAGVGGTSYTNALRGLLITGGVATNGGGGIRSFSAWDSGVIRLTISNCVIRGNTAVAPSWYNGGGGISVSRNTFLTMVDCEVVENSDQTGSSGGGVWCYSDSIFRGVSFISNTTTRGGGGICFRAGYPATLIGCTLSGNSSTDTSANDRGGGAIHTVENCPVLIYNSTIASNSALRRCGGINSVSSSQMILISTLVADNSDTVGYPDVYGTFTGVTNSLIEVPNDVTLPGENNIFGEDPKLEPLADNGGKTRTHALHRRSPAIDKGANPLGLLYDQRGNGFPRKWSADFDIGAIEAPSPRLGTKMEIR